MVIYCLTVLEEDYWSAVINLITKRASSIMVKWVCEARTLSTWQWKLWLKHRCNTHTTDHNLQLAPSTVPLPRHFILKREGIQLSYSLSLHAQPNWQKATVVKGEFKGFFNKNEVLHTQLWKNYENTKVRLSQFIITDPLKNMVYPMVKEKPGRNTSGKIERM